VLRFKRAHAFEAPDLLNRNTECVLSRFAARVVTGPVAFLVGGVIDVLVYAVGAARARVRRSRGDPPGS
jgi:hypothetical protein